MQNPAQFLKRYLVASDFDQTLSFHDSGYVLSEMVGLPGREFERKTAILSVQNFVQQGAELSYLLLHDPDLHARVRREHLIQAGKTSGSSGTSSSCGTCWPGLSTVMSLIFMCFPPPRRKSWNRRWRV